MQASSPQTRQAALRQARELADTSWLPMTVCRDKSGRWAVIESTSPRMRQAKSVAVTLLPRGYFTGYWPI